MTIKISPNSKMRTIKLTKDGKCRQPAKPRKQLKFTAKQKLEQIAYICSLFDIGMFDRPDLSKHDVIRVIRDTIDCKSSTEAGDLVECRLHLNS